MHVYEGLPGVNARGLLDAPLIRRELSEMLALPLKATVAAHEYNGEARRCYHLFSLSVACHPELPAQTYGGFGEGNLFLHHALSVGSWRDGSAAYEAGLFTYATSERFAYPGFLGYADDNFLDGTQSGNWVVTSPGSLDVGFGPSMTAVHEYGHHFGLRHPFDGYDYEEDRGFGPRGSRYFTWVGNVIRRNRVYDNWRRGTMQVSLPDAVANPGADPNAHSTSHRNRYHDNVMGVARDGRRAPNGLDFWCDEAEGDTTSLPPPLVRHARSTNAQAKQARRQPPAHTMLRPGGMIHSSFAEASTIPGSSSATVTALRFFIVWASSDQPLATAPTRAIGPQPASALSSAACARASSIVMSPNRLSVPPMLTGRTRIAETSGTGAAASRCATTSQLTTLNHASRYSGRRFSYCR